MAKVPALMSAAISAVVGMTIAGMAQADPAPVPKFKVEKCFGVARAAQNDCATALHSCAGESMRDGDQSSWIYVPAGTCQKIAGGSLKSA